VTRTGAIAAITGLLLSGCASEGQSGQSGSTAGPEFAVPDACQLVDRTFLVSLLGDQAGSPKPEGGEKSERRSCTWLTASTGHRGASLVIHVAGEGRRGIADKKTRTAHARELYDRRTLHGRGACEYFQGAGYRACWFLHRLSLSVEILKEDLIITVLATSADHQGMEQDELIASARALADHVTAKL
jgi:hypothetical protein